MNPPNARLKTILAFHKDETGTTALEFGLIAAGIAIAIITAVIGVAASCRPTLARSAHR